MVIATTGPLWSETSNVEEKSGRWMAEKIEKNRNKKTFKITGGSPAG